MAGPWEKYQKGAAVATNTAAAKPWEKYQAAPAEEPEEEMSPLNPMANPMISSAVHEAGRFGKSMVQGKPIGEYLPIVGAPIAEAGTKIGAGISAATQAPFSDESYQNLYARNLARSQKAEEEKAAIDAESGTGMLAKSVMANLAVPTPKALMTEKYIPQAASMAGKVGRFALGTGEKAAYTGAINAADIASRGGTSEEALEAGKEGGLWSAGMDIAPKILQGLGSAYRRGMAGLRPETVQHYRQNRARVQGISEPQAADELGQAAENIRGRGQQIREGVGEEVESLKAQAKAEAGLRETAALKKVDETKAKGLGQADEIQRGVAEDLSKQQKLARQAVNQAAQEAMAVAEESGAMIKIAPFKGSLTQRLDNFNVGQTRMGGGVDALEKLRERLDQIGDKEISAVEFRRLIKSLDDEIEEIMGATAKAGYITPAQREMSGVRRGWKEKMETEVPGYAEAQAKTAGKTQALKGFQDQFSHDPDALHRELKGITGVGKKGQMESLQKFENEFGPGPGGYSEGGQYGPGGGGGYSQRLGEAERLRNVDYGAAAQPELQRAQEMRGEKFKKYFADQLGEAERLKEVSRGVTEDTAPNYLRRFGNQPEKNYPIGRRLEGIAREENVPGMAGTYSEGEALSLPRPEDAYTRSAKDLATQRAMQSSFTRGSRNVNLAAMSAAGLGNLLGAGIEKLPGLSSLGAVIGGASDIMGPSIVRKVVDLVDSPMGQRFKKIYEAAAQRGPQAIATTHAMLLKQDPEYRQQMEGNQ